MAQDHYATPLEAAREDIPAQYSPPLFVEVFDENAVVLLGTNDGPDLNPYEVFCHGVEGGWQAGESSNMSMSDPRIGLVTFWDSAAAEAAATIVRYGESTYRIPTYRGHFLFTTWSARVRSASHVSNSPYGEFAPFVVDPAEVIPVVPGAEPAVIEHVFP